MDYKVGDKVRVRKDLVVNKEKYFSEDGKNYVILADDMEKFLGKVVTIRAVTTKDGSIKYHLVEDEECYYWVSEMFEKQPVEEFDAIYSDGVTTVVIWDKATKDKTIVKKHVNDVADPVVAFLYAFFEKQTGKTKEEVKEFTNKLREEHEKQTKGKMRKDRKVKFEDLVNKYYILINSESEREKFNTVLKEKGVRFKSGSLAFIMEDINVYNFEPNGRLMYASDEKITGEEWYKEHGYTKVNFKDIQF